MFLLSKFVRVVGDPTHFPSNNTNNGVWQLRSVEQFVKSSFATDLANHRRVKIKLTNA